MSTLKRICLIASLLSALAVLGWFAAAQGNGGRCYWSWTDWEFNCRPHRQAPTAIPIPKNGPEPGSGRMLMQVLFQCAVNRSNRFTRQAGLLPVLGYLGQFDGGRTG